MPWFRVDDDFHNHPKVQQLRSTRHFGAAIALWTLAGSWCAHYLTGGALPKSWLKSAGFPPKIGRELVRVGLWEDRGDSYQFHQWAERQPAATQVVERREKHRQKMAAWRARKAAADQPVTAAVTTAQTASPGNGAAGGAEVTPCFPIPIPKERGVKISEPTYPPSAPPPARALPRESPEHSVCVRVEDGFTAERMSRIFQREYLGARKTLPAMGGRNVGEFHRRVLATAEARNADPEALFTAVLARYLAEPPTNIGKIAPYANFASQFDVLLEPDEKAQKSAELERFRAEVSQMLPSSRKQAHNGP